MVNTRGGLLTLGTLWWLPAACYSEEGEVALVTSVSVNASSYVLEGCYEDGCEPELTLDRLIDAERSRWTCQATETVPCDITYTFGEPRLVEKLYLDFTNVTEDMPVIISTLESSADEDYVDHIIETLGWSNSSEVFLRVDLQPVPLATAVKIEADLPAGGWVSLFETFIYVTLEEDEETMISASSGGSYSSGLIVSLVSAIILCFGGGWGVSASASASASASSF